MHETLTPAETRQMLAAMARRLIENVEVLTAVDQAIGDGDHGIGMRRGANAILAQSEGEAPAGVAAVLQAAGMAIMANTGGAAGAVFGTLFRSGGMALADRTCLDGEGLARLLTAGCAAVEQRGGARPGQKTMLDALAPAAAAAAASATQGLAAAATAAAAAARKGMEATRSMVATTGKARTLGERSLGHPDPGAVSLTLMLEAMRDYITGP